MGLFKITVKRGKIVSGIRLEEGMCVEVASSYSIPRTINDCLEVIDAFERKCGIDIKKSNGLSSSTLNVQKM